MRAIGALLLSIGVFFQTTAAEQEFKIIGGSGIDSTTQQAMLDKIKQQQQQQQKQQKQHGGGPGGGQKLNVPKQKQFNAKDLEAMGYKTRAMPPPKGSNETAIDREMRKAFTLQDGNNKVLALAHSIALPGNQPGIVCVHMLAPGRRLDPSGCQCLRNRWEQAELSAHGGISFEGLIFIRCHLAVNS
eukprot:SAG31_NODE_600_length_13647_cov_3.894376_14_plen_187_part_00